MSLRLLSAYFTSSQKDNNSKSKFSAFNMYHTDVHFKLLRSDKCPMYRDSQNSSNTL